jgi:hypothetical protein
VFLKHLFAFFLVAAPSLHVASAAEGITMIVYDNKMEPEREINNTFPNFDFNAGRTDGPPKRPCGRG